MRDVIATEGGFEKVENNKLEDKYAYFNFMTGAKDFMEINGR